MATLPSTNSVVDYLASQGKDSSFSARRKMYNDLGLNKRLGDFTGAANQNLSLLDNLRKTTTAKPTASSVLNSFTPKSGVQTSTPSVKTPTQKTAQNSGISGLSLLSGGSLAGLSFKPNTVSITPQTKGLTFNTPTPTQTQTPGLTSLTGKPLPKFSFSNEPALRVDSKGKPITTTPTKKETPITPSPQTRVQTPQIQQSQDNDTQTQQNTGGLSASILFPDIFNESTPDEADLVNTWLNSPEGKLFLERQALSNQTAEGKAESAKAELEAKYAQEKDSLENKLAENGLAFSGIRGTKVKALADALAASTLNVDREFASKLLDANLDLREAILDGVASLAKDAADNRKEAIQQLNAIGYAVIGGQLVPTLASRSAERADRQLEMSERRLQLSEESSARAEARFEQLYGSGRGGGFDYVRQLMELNPNATRAELKAASLENTNLSSTEIDSVLDTVGLAPNQAVETAKVLVANNFSEKFFNLDSTDLEKAKEAAKNTIRSTGGVLKVGGRTVTLTADQLVDLENYIDTVTLQEAKDMKELLNK